MLRADLCSYSQKMSSQDTMTDMRVQGMIKIET